MTDLITGPGEYRVDKVYVYAWPDGARRYLGAPIPAHNMRGGGKLVGTVFATEGQWAEPGDAELQLEAPNDR